MSLAAFLVTSKPSGKNKVIDRELDALFDSQTPLDHPESTSNDHPAAEKKKKKKRKSDTHNDDRDRKRPKPSLADAAISSFLPIEKCKNHRVKITSAVSDSDSSDAPKAGSLNNVFSHEPTAESSDGDDPSTLVHETLQTNRHAMGRKGRAPSNETQESRDARTIFIGNVAPDVAIKRPLQKQLRRHILAFLPAAKIESTRFRSVAFQTPTSKHPEIGDKTKKNKQPRQHDRERASSWRGAHPGDKTRADEKKFLTPSQRKKVAFINKDIHSGADSVHAYIVFAYPPPPHSRSASSPLPTVMDPFEAACLAIEKCNGTTFLDRMLRVDAVVKRSAIESLSNPLLNYVGDPKLTIFIGNLDFTSKEEDLRVFFEGIVSAERGPPAVESQGGDHPKCWVTHVRMIRDKSTQLGKGFAYVQFSDRTCVDEILALEPGELTFAKRKLRVQRCKSTPSSTSIKYAPPSGPAMTTGRTPAPPLPKGDPSLGEKLVKLTKEERKRVKAVDADRITRRIAKKKARVALAKQGMSLQNKQRERVRKTKNSSGGTQKNANKRRVRSEKSTAKRNMKK